MAIRPGLNEFVSMAAGALIMLVLVVVALYLDKERNPAAQVAFKAKRVELVTRMRLDLALAAEAEKSAVMATTDRDSQTFADQARAATAAVERGRKELEGLLNAGGAKSEEGLLARFSEAFADSQRVDKGLLELAVQNTNLKAYGLAYGPAAEALKEMDAALSRIVVESANSGALARPSFTSTDAMQVIQLASDCRIGALRIQTLLPPHIAEESGQKMDELEALMTKEDGEVRRDLESLAALLKSSGNPDIETARLEYAKFSEITTEVIKLSRENTNVRSLAISLNRKRTMMLMCQDALAALEQAIQQEPIAGVANGNPAYPR